MQRDFDGHKRERTPDMNVEYFIEANEDIISEYWIEAHPTEAWRINDGDTEAVWDWAYEDSKDFYEDIMHDFYQDHINGL